MEGTAIIIGQCNGTSLRKQFDIWFPAGEAINPMIGPWDLRCAVFVNLPPRNDYFEWLLENGRSNVDRVFQGEPISQASLFFCLPERWMTPQEARAFMSFLRANPSTLDGTLKQVLLYTQSPILIGEIAKEQIVLLHDGQHNPINLPFYAAVEANEKGRNAIDSTDIANRSDDQMDLARYIRKVGPTTTQQYITKDGIIIFGPAELQGRPVSAAKGMGYRKVTPRGEEARARHEAELRRDYDYFVLYQSWRRLDWE